MHKGITVKVLLDNSTTGIFMDREMAKRHGFYHKWLLTICDKYFDTLKSSKM